MTEMTEVTDKENQKAVEENAKRSAEEKKADATGANEEKDSEKESRKDKKNADGLKRELAAANKEIEDLKHELADQNDRYARMFAEYENYRRRSAKDRENAYSDAYSKVVVEMLPVLDNLERALMYPDNIKDGVSLTMKSFVETLEKFGIKETEALGKEFDPNLHNAVMHIEDENYGENEIVEVLQKGYTCNGKVVRYSMVKVAN